MRTLLLPLLVSFSLAIGSQPSGSAGAIADVAAQDTAPQAAVAAFPASWSGTWKGEVTPFSPRGAGEPFTMTLAIAATDDPARFTWTITYEGAAGTQVRPYHLLVRDSARGAFAIDEGGGVVLEGRFLGGVWYTWFEIGGTRLLVREELQAAGTPEASISFEIVTASAAASAAGSAPAGAPVSVPPAASQRACLRRVAP